ncbi:uncharacterized protein MELLADRAFT_107239 [Melampsora larici-populina 98AG31]|uniref:Pre-rRNA-processing protein n=1 Tax=Melampsora larici-populina (strain 98AG31 / pathotype 3-4-7) TaxID=747676 RepID=F4RPA6_MELLP|nr:uncharacterized protein MELLADRAFT_107239 [Melampsora larici-populina 98AG31]EGG05882.1 hypothetical protein MELLADRAFT_107239 [Melampsora larici-populina 98AG31]
MPKSQKQKKAATADFSKAKLKLGKGKQIASNATNTSYSTKVIALPNQNIGAEKGEAPTTRRNLTLDDLLVHLRHYSHATRKDALIGLRELLGAHHELWRSNLGPIIHGAARLIPDENASVRKALIAFFAWFLPQIPTDLVTPFCSAIVFFASSALAHIFAEIRVDAVQIIDLLLEISPNTVIGGWWSDTTSPTNSSSGKAQGQHGRRLLQLYLSMLSIGPDAATSGVASTSSNRLTDTSKLMVLKSLSRFIHAATRLEASESEKTTLPLWFFQVAFNNPRDFEQFRNILPDQHQSVSSQTPKSQFGFECIDDQNTHCYEPFAEVFMDRITTNPQARHDVPSYQVDNNTKDIKKSGEDAFPDSPLKLFRVMNPVLLSIFLDSAPTAFHSEMASNETVQLASKEPSTHLGLVWCVGRILCDLWRASVTSNSNIIPTDSKNLAHIMEKMSTYFIFGADELNSKNTKSDAITMNPGMPVLPPDSYVAMLPTIWSLLGRRQHTSDIDQPASHNWSDQIMNAFIDHLDHLRPSSELKALGISFLGRIIIIDDLPGCSSPFRLESASSETQEKLRKWILSLPKVLWALDNKNPMTSKTILSFLHHITTRSLSFFQTVLPDLAPLLTPFFAIKHPTHQRSILGPYSRLPIDSQKLAQGLVG